MKALYALYSNPDAAQSAVEALRASPPEMGVSEKTLVVQSSEPFEHHEFTRRAARTPMPWIAAAGGLLGGLSGYALTALTQQSYPLPTGGMTISPMWTNGIIIYELIMLGAILGTIFTLLFSARLPRWRRPLLDRDVSSGLILVGVLNPPEAAHSELRNRLRQSGAIVIRESS